MYLVKSKIPTQCTVCREIIPPGIFYEMFRDEPDRKECFPRCLTNPLSTLNGSEYSLGYYDI